MMDSADNNDSINSMAIIDEIEDDRSDIDSVNNDNSESAVDSDQEHVEEDEEESNSGKFTEKPFVYNNFEVNINHIQEELKQKLTEEVEHIKRVLADDWASKENSSSTMMNEACIEVKIMNSFASNNFWLIVLRLVLKNELIIYKQRTIKMEDLKFFIRCLCACSFYKKSPSFLWNHPQACPIFAAAIHDLGGWDKFKRIIQCFSSTKITMGMVWDSYFSSVSFISFHIFPR